MISKIKLIPIVLLSFTGVSATVVGVNQYINNVQQEENPVKNPVLTLDANDSDAHFSSGDRVISKIVKYGLSWANYSKNMPIPTKPGFDIIGWEYSHDGVNYSDVYNDLIFDQNTYLRVKEWGAATKDHFATDSWATVVSIAQNGLAALKEAYFSDISSYGNTFVIQDYSNAAEVAAKTRTVYLKGIGEYKVHVIGEDTDKIANEDNKVAALTFEFDDVVVPSIGYSLGGDDNSWSNSYVRRFLQNSFIQRLPEPINDDQVLQTVVKRTYNQALDDFEESNDTIFIPSLSELGYEYMNEQRLTEDAGDVAYNNRDCLDEGNPYNFYLHGANNSARLKKYNNVNSTYWTRSPFTTDINAYYLKGKPSGDITKHKGVHFIAEDGSVPGMYEARKEGQKSRANNSVNGISPCFCIGTDTVHKLIVNVDGANVIAHGTQYVANGLNASVRLTDSRDYSAPVIHGCYEEVGPEKIKVLTKYKEISVKMNGNEIPMSVSEPEEPIYTNYSYNKKTGLLNINIDKNYLPITNNIFVTISKVDKDYYTFETASWDDFFSDAEEGYEFLKKKYINDFNDNGGTFLGLKRMVTLKDGDLETAIPVRVIGEKHDDIANSNQKTALTFQFTRGYQVDPEMEGEHSRDIGMYKTMSNYSAMVYPSPISYISDPDGPHVSLNEWPTYLEDLNIDDVKEVNKNVATISMLTSNLESFTAHFFLPSIEELIGDNLMGYAGEGTQYEYFKNENDDSMYRCCSSSYISSFHERNANGLYMTRSLASSSLTERKYKFLAVNGQLGSISSINVYDDLASLLPCFAVGVSEA